MKALLNIKNELSLVDNLEEPKTVKGEVKVRVHYASLNPTDLDIARGDLDLFLKLYGAKSPVRTGLEFSGTVTEDSAKFRKGDRVFGYTHLMKGPKTHQEIVSIPESYVAVIPNNMGFAEAAAFPLGAQTSLVALRDVAKLKAGQSVFINGGSGGLGVFAIQIAKTMQLSVTAVSGPNGLQTMRAMGADTVINYRETPVDKLKGSFDAILDLSNKYSFRNMKHLLAPKGVFIPVDPLKHLAAFAGNAFRRKKTGYLFVDKGDGEILAHLAKQVENGSFDASHYQEFPMVDYQIAIRALGEPGNIGRTVLRMT